MSQIAVKKYFGTPTMSRDLLLLGKAVALQFVTDTGKSSPDDSDGSKGRIMEYACLGRVGLGREFYDMMVQTAEED